MKATGVVRRIDELGRIVIPKEMRRVLNIRESDSMEIYSGNEGEIILKKYSPMKELQAFAKKYTDSLAQTTGTIAAVTDREQIIAVSGGLRGSTGRGISKELESAMDNRQFICADREQEDFIPVFDREDDFKQEIDQEIISPILCEGDVIGAVLLLSTENKEALTEAERKLVQTAAAFFGKHMEQ